MRGSWPPLPELFSAGCRTARCAGHHPSQLLAHASDPSRWVPAWDHRQGWTGINLWSDKFHGGAWGVAGAIGILMALPDLWSDPALSQKKTRAPNFAICWEGFSRGASVSKESPTEIWHQNCQNGRYAPLPPPLNDHWVAHVYTAKKNVSWTQFSCVVV